MTYPDEVMRAARETAAAVYESEGQIDMASMIRQAGFDNALSVQSAARAIMAERERAQGAPASGPGSCPAGRNPAGSDASRGDPSRGWPDLEWEDGYPVAEDDDFAAWKALPIDFQASAAFLLRELPKAAEHCCASCEVEDTVDELFGNRPVKRIAFSTGGWSGAEWLLAFIEGRFDTAYFMLRWKRGGHYLFEIPATFLEPPASAMSAEGEDAKRLRAKPASAIGEAETPE